MRRSQSACGRRPGPVLAWCLDRDAVFCWPGQVETGCMPIDTELTDRAPRCPAGFPYCPTQSDHLSSTLAAARARHPPAYPIGSSICGSQIARRESARQKFPLSRTGPQSESLRIGDALHPIDPGRANAPVGLGGARLRTIDCSQRNERAPLCWVSPTRLQASRLFGSRTQQMVAASRCYRPKGRQLRRSSDTYRRPRPSAFRSSQLLRLVEPVGASISMSAGRPSARQSRRG